MEQILLHTCCAPCSVSVIDILKKQNFKPSIFWFNPNIHPYTEFKIRKQTLLNFISTLQLNFIDGGAYDIKNFLLYLNNKFDFFSRCSLCYKTRLKQTAKFAKKLGFNTFSTTLLISPFQKHELIKNLAEIEAKKHGLNFFYFDFRPFFKQGQKKAKELGFYMQKYCGCIFSEEERFCNYAKRKLLKQIKQNKLFSKNESKN